MRLRPSSRTRTNWPGSRVCCGIGEFGAELQRAGAGLEGQGDEVQLSRLAEDAAVGQRGLDIEHALGQHQALGGNVPPPLEDELV